MAEVPDMASDTQGYDADGWTREAEVPSMSGGKQTYYVDSHITGRWRCTCMDYINRRQYKGEDCKHIKIVKQAQYEQGQGVD